MPDFHKIVVLMDAVSLLLFKKFGC